MRLRLAKLGRIHTLSHAVLEVLESNGSSSISICAGAATPLNGGVPIKAPVAGIAMGLSQMEITIQS